MPAICQPHNLPRPIGQGPKPYGVRVSLRPGDPFRRIMGAEWHRVHWFASVAKPALVFEKVENLAASRGL
jgi:hypothetical protein